MSLLDLFRSKPKRCSSCMKLSRGLHIVYGGLRGGEIERRLCHECLIGHLGEHLPGKSLIFFEPPTSDSYVFLPLGELSADTLVATRTALALDSLGPTCISCSSAPQHLWMPQDDLDSEAMEKQPPTQYFSIPRPPHQWASALALCEPHTLSHLREYLEGKRYYFLTFRFPDSSVRGCYW